MMRRATMLMAAGLMLPGCLPALAGGGGLPLELLGEWDGRGSQDDPPGEWSIAVEIVGGEPGGIVGTIAYPSLGCRGELRLRASTAVTMELKERITAGSCLDGTVILTAQEDGRLRYAWRNAERDVEAKGVLWRRGSGEVR